jgi:hypothetical protein
VLGLKSIAALAIGVLAIGAAAWRGLLDPGHLASLSATAAFLVGLVASLTTGLVASGWKPEARSDSGVAIHGGRPEVIDGPTRRVRELPGLVQRLVLVAAMASLTLVALGNHAAARITQLPADLSAPSPSSYCMAEVPAAEPAPAPVQAPPPVEQPGCALVRRAFKLGYAKSLGACAPKQAAPAVTVKSTTKEVCSRRQLDEPYLHYGFRRVAGAVDAAVSVSPGTAIGNRVDHVRTHLDYLDGLLADIRHAITGTPHAAHHLWIGLPDPHRGSALERTAELFTGTPRCSTRFASLPLWPAWSSSDAADVRGLVVEHVLGQLLFATRFGTTASCNDYVIHWDAPADACARLAADPAGFLGETGGLASIRAVLDRRRRQLELRELAARLGRPVPAEPPPASAVASLSCISIGGAPTAASPAGAQTTGRTVRLDGDELSLREVKIPEIRTTADGPIDVYVALASLLAGPTVSPRASTAPDPGDLDGSDFVLTRLDPLVDADPFAGVRWPLADRNVVDVFPFERHLHAFIDAFRRRYLPQRGRL